MLPNFLIIGAPRSGTTSLYAALRQHPEIYFSEFKEPWFFSLFENKSIYTGPGDNTHKRVNNLEEYEALFSGVSGEKAYGEASTLYLHCNRAPIHIKEMIPDVKLIVILRNPVDRAFSNYQLHRTLHREPLSDFKQSLEKEESRKEIGWSPFWLYTELGFYGKQLENYLRFFDRSQINIYLFDDLVNEKENMYQSVFEFLGVDSSFRPIIEGHFNSSGEPKSELLHYFLNKPNKIKSSIAKAVHPKLRYLVSSWLANARNHNLTISKTLDQDLRHELMALYKDDVIKLQNIIERDLSSWIDL